MPLGTEDRLVLQSWLHPETVVPLARELGGGDPVLGAEPAYRRLRTLIRQYARFMAWRDGDALAGRGLAMALRALGVVGRVQRVGGVLEDRWRGLAQRFWHAPAPTPGFVEIAVPEASQSLVDRAVLVAVSEMLRSFPRLNVACLRGQVYTRTTSEIMVNTVSGGSVVSIMFDAAGRTSREVNRKLIVARRRFGEAAAHPLAPLGAELLGDWMEAGLIASPAGAMVACVGGAGVPMGHLALVPGNGVPLGVCVGRVRGGRVTLGLTLDHRAFDGPECGVAYATLETEVPRLCAHWLSGARRGSARPSPTSSSGTDTTC